MKSDTPKRLRLSVLRMNSESAILRIRYKNRVLLASYRIDNHTLVFRKNNNTHFRDFVSRFQEQLIRIVKSIPKATFQAGLNLFIVLGVKQPKINTKADQLIILDKTTHPFRISQEKWLPLTTAVAYTDGSYDNTKEKGGYAVLIKNTNKEKIISNETRLQGNNLIELHAVIQALRYLRKERRVRIVTDSQYVIKGLLFWIEVWRHNHWYTASDKKARHKKQWIQLDKLTRNKIIEIKWVKGHNHHTEHTLCDKLAKSHLTK